MTYERLEQSERQPRKIRDHTRTWLKLQPLADVNGAVSERVAAFCSAKRITVDALAALEPRIAIRRGGSIWLAYAGRNNSDVVTAIKYRPLDGTSHDSDAEKPSVWLQPIIVGNRHALDWFLAEGETDTARLYDLIGDKAAIVCLPAGARTFKREWADLIPRGATVYLCHDADIDGDNGAVKAAELLGGRTVRVRPPHGDWCDWDGGRDDFVKLVAEARATEQEIEPLNLSELLAGPVPEINWQWHKWIAQGELVLFAATAGTGKSIMALLLCCAVRRGGPLLDAETKPGNVGYIDFENPKPVVHLRLRQAGISSDDNSGIVYFHFPPIDVVAPKGEQWLQRVIEQYQLRLLVLDSFRRIAPGVDENDSAEVSAFFAPLRRLTVNTGCTILLLHHPKKQQHDNPSESTELVRGSGDFTASVDTILFARRKPPDAFTLEGFGKRTGSSHEPILVRLSPVDSQTLYLTNEGNVAYAEDKVETLLARIVKALEDDGGVLLRQQLALRLEVDPKNSSFGRALNLGFQRDLLAKDGGHGKPTSYSLAPKAYE